MYNISQTNRTILFEVFNPNSPSLITLIGEARGRESLSEEELHIIHEKLVVSSFDEFIEKFKPCVHITSNPNDCYGPYLKEELTGRNLTTITIPIDTELPFLANILDLIESKKSANFAAEKLTEVTSYLPIKQDSSKFYNIRRKLKEVFLQFHQKDTGYKLINAEKLAEGLYREFDDNLFLLNLYIRDFQRYLSGYKTEKEIEKPIRLHDLQESQVELMESSGLGNCGEEYFKNELSNEYKKYIHSLLELQPFQNKRLLEDVLTLQCESSTFELEDAILKYNHYAEYYHEIVVQLIRSTKPVIESVLSVKAFFEQNNKKQIHMKPVLLITNCETKVFFESKYKERLELYLTSVNETNYDKNTIWYGIIPHLLLLKEKELHLSRERFKGNAIRSKNEAESLEGITQLLKSLKKYRIQTFISNKTVTQATFQYVAINGIRPWELALMPLRKIDCSEYIIPSYPNFTILPGKDTYIEIADKAIFLEDGRGKILENDSLVVRYEGITIEASYIAAGLIAACQCPVYLEYFYKNKINAGLPGVAYQLCNNGQNRITFTTMYPEIFGYPDKVKEEILNNGSGIIFAADEKKPRVIALTDRTMPTIAGLKEGIANIQTLTYMERVMRYYTMDYKNDLVLSFFKNDVNNVVAYWTGDKDIVNAVLKEKEEVNFEIDEKNSTVTLLVTFTNGCKEEKINVK
jgi:hypothetical protein